MDKIFFSIPFILLCGCATIQPTVPIESRHRTYTESFNKVWNIVIEMLNEDSLPISILDKDSGVISTNFVITGAWSVTKKDSILEPDAKYTLNILVKKINENTTELTINPHIERWVFNGWVDISGRDTILQDKYFSRIEGKLNK
jgi:hypothetical protein